MALTRLVRPPCHLALRALFADFHQLLLCPSIQKMTKVAPQHCTGHAEMCAIPIGLAMSKQMCRLCPSTHLPPDEGQPEHGGREPLAVPVENYRVADQIASRVDGLHMFKSRRAMAAQRVAD